MITTDKCPICSKHTPVIVKRKINLAQYSGFARKIMGEYDKLSKGASNEEVLACCMNCRSIFRAKFFDNNEIEYIYNTLYHSVEESLLNEPGFIYNKEPLLNKMASQTMDIVKNIEKLHNRLIKSVFDIGGRDGFRLKALAHNGYNCTVFDPIECKPCDKMIKKEYIWSSQIEKDKKADLIILCNVLEHCIDPQETIKSCYDHLNENGILYIELPYDIGTFFDWLLLGIWRNRNLDIDNTHYIFYSVRAVARLLDLSGFRYLRNDFYFLPDMDVRVMGITAQKTDTPEIGISARLSFCFDSLRSGYFSTLFKRSFRKFKNTLLFESAK